MWMRIYIVCLPKGIALCVCVVSSLSLRRCRVDCVRVHIVLFIGLAYTASQSVSQRTKCASIK